jgi:hypothetical protein
MMAGVETNDAGVIVRDVVTTESGRTYTLREINDRLRVHGEELLLYVDVKTDLLFDARVHFIAVRSDNDS